MVMRSGGPGALTSLFVRGGESDYNKVLLDGVPLNEPGGIFYLNNLTTENLERVEIVRGAYSSLFGSDAMASVIQLFTRRATASARRPRGQRQIDGGTYGTFHGSAGVSGATDALGLQRRRRAVRQRQPRAEQPAREHDAQRQRRRRASDETADAAVRRPRRARTRRHARDRPPSAGRTSTRSSSATTASSASASISSSTPSFRQRAAYSLAASNQQSTNLIEPIPPIPPTFEGRIAVFTSSDFLNDSARRLRRHHASYQADWRLATGSARRSPPDAARRLGRRARDAGEPAGANDHVELAATTSASPHSIRCCGRGCSSPSAASRAQRQLRHGSGTARHAGVRRHERRPARRRHPVKVSAGTGIKEPTMLESFSLSPFFRGNPDLKPERSRSVEVGVEQRFADDRAKVELTCFDNRFRDIISLRTNPLTFEGQYFNVGDTHARGVELGVEAAPHPAVRPAAAIRSSTPRSSRRRRRERAVCPGQLGVPPAAALRFDRRDDQVARSPPT